MQKIVDQCPLPDLANALQPYIRTREEAVQIRHNINSFLAQHIRDENTPLSKATLLTAETSLQSTVNSHLSGVRRAYLQALIARQKAQSQYDSLKEELNLLQTRAVREEHKEPKETLVANTVALIRQRQRRDKLLIIDKTLDKLEKVRHASRYADPSELLNKLQGQVPPPLAQQSQDESFAEAQSHVFELQKAVLRAQNSAQTQNSTSPAQRSTAEEWKRASALRRARDELIAWIEDELAKLSNEEEHLDPQMDLPGDLGIDSLDEIKVTLVDLYNKYITSRERLVRVLSTEYKAKPDATELPTLEQQKSQTSGDSQGNAGLASRVLPFIEILRSTAQDEAALMQQTSYLRRQVTTVSTETEQLLVRLSDESHMVRPGTSHTTAWAEAAKDAKLRDMDVINSHLSTGETSIKAVRDVLASAQMSR